MLYTRIRPPRTFALWAAAGAFSLVVTGGTVQAQLRRPTGRPAAPTKPAPTAAEPKPAATERTPAAKEPAADGDENPLDGVDPKHPLMPVLQYAVDGLKDLEKIQDYSCTLVKRERVDGVVGPLQYFSCKIRHEPFSVYMQFLSPKESKGQEVIYVKGQNGDKLMAHTVGLRDRVVGTLALDPRGKLAMMGNRYPITEVGILNLTRRLIEVGKVDAQFGECEVKITPKAKINDRECKLIECVHPDRRPEFRFHIAKIYIDEEIRVPVRYQAFSWPTKAGGEPVLEEEYTYLDVKLNNGFTDTDFSVNNRQYRFR